MNEALLQWATLLLSSGDYPVHSGATAFVEDQGAADAYRSLSGVLEGELARESVAAQRWFSLKKRFGLSELELNLLGVLVAQDLDYDIYQGFRRAWADPTTLAMPLGFGVRAARAWAAPDDARQNAEDVATIRRSALMRLGVLQLLGSGHPASSAAVVLSPAASFYLTGHDTQFNRRTVMASEVDEPPARLREEHSVQLRRMGGERPLRAAIFGASGCGRFELAAQLAHRHAEDGLMLRVRVSQRSLDDGSFQQAAQVATLRQALLILEVGDVQDLIGLSRQVTELLEQFPELGFIWLASHVEPAEYGVSPENCLTIGYPSRDQRRELWREALGPHSHGLSADEVSRLATSFILSEQDIAEAVQRAAVEVGYRGARWDRALRREARICESEGMGQLATPQECKVGLEALIVDQETEHLLQQLLTYAEHRNELTVDWGFAEQMSYGLGLTALFTGPPGTGKTLAATAIAHELGLELYRVDLSQLVSKYIGETEKHLAQVFDEAARGGIMLLFDEADSLFAKRTEVRSSVDRYANLEVNYLLQRIEHFQGIVILTTNFEAGLDDAFSRRIRFSIAFDEPDARQRRRLWRALIPGELPLDDDVELDLLADTFEMSGGHIKETVLRGASLAYGRSETVKMAHFWEAARAEYRKMGKLNSPSLEDVARFRPIDDTDWEDDED